MNGPALMLMALGGGCFYSTFAILRAARQRMRRTARTTGTVIGHELRYQNRSQSDRHRIPTKHAEITYQVGGQAYTYVSSVGASWEVHKIGQRLTVCYDPAQPVDAGFPPNGLTKSLEFIAPIVFPLAGVILIGIGISRL